MAKAEEPLHSRSATTRETILLATRELLVEIGAERIRVADIARRAGMTTGAIYGQFRDRAELLDEARLAHYERHVRAGISRAKATVALPTGQREAAARQGIRALLTGDGWSGVLERLAVVGAAHHSEHLQRELQQLNDRLLADTAEMVRASQADGRIDARLDAGAVAAFWNAIPIGLAALFPEIPEDEVEAFIDLWRFLISAMAPPTS